MEFEPMLTPREKSPLPKMSPVEDRTRDAVDSEPKHYQLSYSGPNVILNLPKKNVHPLEADTKGRHSSWLTFPSTRKLTETGRPKCLKHGR